MYGNAWYVGIDTKHILDMNLKIYRSPYDKIMELGVRELRKFNEYHDSLVSIDYSDSTDGFIPIENENFHPGLKDDFDSFLKQLNLDVEAIRT